VLIRADGVGKKFCRSLKKSLFYGMQDVGYDILGINRSQSSLREAEFWANEDISFELKRGECLGLIGQNGAGKTTLLKMLNGLIKPDSGHIEMRGRVGAMIALGAGFNPILTGRENVYIAASVLGFGKQEVNRRFDEIVDFAGIEKFIDTPVQSYSSGMQVRLGFAVASSLDPDILLIDEVLAVGDVGFRTKCYNRIFEICNRAAVIFVSHNMPQVDRLCSRAMVLTGGKEVFCGMTGKAINEYNKLFSLQSREWQIKDGFSINHIAVNGKESGEKVMMDGGAGLEIEINLNCPYVIEKAELTVSLLEKSYDLVSQASTRFQGDHVSLRKGENVIAAKVEKIMAGSGLKLLSIAIVNSENTNIIFWAHGGWEMQIENQNYIPSPVFNHLKVTK